MSKAELFSSRKKRRQEEWLGEEVSPSMPAKVVNKENPLIASQLTVLTALLSGKVVTLEMLSSAAINDESIINKIALAEEGQKPLKTETVINTESKEALKRSLFASISQHTNPFPVVSQSPGHIVYGDPSEPQNIEKQIQYRWNPFTGKWKIIPGSQSNAIIPDEANSQLIRVTEGIVESYGQGQVFEVENAAFKTVSGNVSRRLSEEQLFQWDEMLTREAEKRRDEKFAPHVMYAFEVLPQHQQAFQKLMNGLRSTNCSLQRAKIVEEFIQGQKGSILIDKMEALPYTDNQGNWYAWKEDGKRGVLGVQYQSDNSLKVLVPDNGRRHEYAVFIGHNDLTGIGLAGAQFLYVKEDGKVDYVSNSEYQDRRDVPQLSREVMRLTEHSVQQHLEYARQSAQSFLKGKEFVANLPKATELEQHPTLFGSPTILTPARRFTDSVASRKTSDLTKGNLLTNTISGLPANIKVTGLDGAPIFELHCSFKQLVHKELADGKDEIEYGCRDEDFNPYQATVYVLKKIGSKFNPDNPQAKDKSESLIIEVREEPYEVRLRSGTRQVGHGVETKGAVSAKVTILDKGKEYAARLTEENGDAKVHLDISEGSPFKESGFSEFMCVDSCCGHYSPEHRQTMKNPAMAKQRV